MTFSLWNLFEASLLCLNAVCILHEERFLVKIGWSAKSQNVHGFGEYPSAKAQILNLVHSIRTVARRCLLVPAISDQFASSKESASASQLLAEHCFRVIH